jgi:hypothetical protein
MFRFLFPNRRKDCKVHLHALCWNEEKMLPHFFRHYDEFVDQYFISDHASTDKSLSILANHPKVQIGKFHVEGDSFVQAATDHYNHCWKVSRGAADWVIICNIDEHLYHPKNLKTYLNRCLEGKISLITPKGYQMYADSFPSDSERKLCESIGDGSRCQLFDKPQIFNPNDIDEIHFTPGRHGCIPTGKVVSPYFTSVKLLHFKYLGLEYLLSREKELLGGLRTLDIKKQWGVQYTWSDERKIAEFEALKMKSKRVL